MVKYAKMLLPLLLIVQTGCLPPNFFENLVGDGIYAVTGYLLSDALYTILPPQ